MTSRRHPRAPSNRRDRDDRNRGSRPGGFAPPTGATRPPAATLHGHRVQSGRQEQDLQGLYALSGVLFASTDEAEILQLTMARVGEITACTAVAGYVVTGQELARVPAGPDHSTREEDLGRQVQQLKGNDGPVALPGHSWSRAWALGGLEGLCGYLVIGGPSPPSREENYLLSVLTQQTSAALSNAAAHRREDEHALELRHRRDELEATHTRLSSSLSKLDHQQKVHDALARGAATGRGVEGIAQALHEITGLAAVIEDRFGNLKAWAGSGCPSPYPKTEPARREQVLQEAARYNAPIRVSGRLLALARPRGETLGVIALVDPDDTAEARTVFALEHAARSLAMELVHLRNLAEVELRTRRELVDDLLTGTDDASAYSRSEAVGHDLHGAHHVVVVQGLGSRTNDALAQAVDRSSSHIGMQFLLTRRSGRVVLVTRDRPRGLRLYEALTREAGTGAETIGVGGRCDTPAQVPRSYEEALRALEIRLGSRAPYGMTFYDSLGLYRLLGPRNDSREVEEFTQQWLGALLDYDSRHRTALVETLSQYFECGGNYDATASALAIHRSTLRYRLQRIRDISGLDLTNVDNRLNLHVATRAWRVLSGADQSGAPGCSR